MKIQKRGFSPSLHDGIFLEGGHHTLREAFDVFKLHGIPSLRAIKARAKHKFKELAFEIHPDTGKKLTINHKHKHGIYFRDLKRMYDRIQNMKFVPMTPGNCDRLLELQKGYKTTNDIDLGLNG